MFIISYAERDILNRIDWNDDIEMIVFIRPELVEILREHDINRVKDLARLGPYSAYATDGVTVEEMDMLLAITNYLFRGAYDNLHG